MTFRCRSSVRSILLLGVASLGCAGFLGCQTNPDAGADWFEGGEAIPPSQSTMRMTTRILAAKGEYAQAEFVVQRLIDEHPQEPGSWTEGAEVLLLQGRVADAITLLDAGLEEIPGNPILLNDRGLCHLLAGALATAASDIRAAYEIDPGDADFVANLALIMALEGDLDAARRLWSRVLPKSDVEANIEIAVRARSRFEVPSEGS